MAWRKAHGNAAKGGETLVWESAHKDPAAKVPEGVAVEIQRDKGGRVRDPEAARKLAKMRGKVPDFVRRDVVCHPDFEPFDRQRKALTRARVSELYQQTGGVSRGVGARVRAACWGVAFGEYLATKAAETGDPELMDRAMAVLSKASVEDEKARRLAVDEAQPRSGESPAERIAREIAATRTLPAKGTR